MGPWSSGYDAALTWQKSQVRILAGPLNFFAKNFILNFQTPTNSKFHNIFLSFLQKTLTYYSLLLFQRFFLKVFVNTFLNFFLNFYFFSFSSFSNFLNHPNKEHKRIAENIFEDFFSTFPLFLLNIFSPPFLLHHKFFCMFFLSHSF